jgi:hypothetical protein
MPTTAQLVLNALIFQLGWWLAVLGGDRVALLVAATTLVLHGLCISRERAEWLCIVATVAIGCVLDSTLHSLDILQFPAFSGVGVPLWLATIWLLFATTLNHSLRWLQKHWFWAVLLGVFIAPLSYWAGVRFGVASFGVATPLALAILAICWGLLLPLLSAMMRHRTRVEWLCKDC